MMMLNNQNILVIGSVNIDMVVKNRHIPLPGETVTGGSFFMNTGGKGANQAIAAARPGAATRMIAKTGRDIFGIQSVERLKENGIDTSLILQDIEYPTGIALILVDVEGENCISVAPGSNARLLPEDISAYSGDILEADIILLQMEIPAITVDYIINRPGKSGARLILNPAPAILDKSGLSCLIDIITPNQREASALAGINVNDITSAGDAASALRNYGIETVIITLGASGAMLAYKNEVLHIPAPEVEVVDTTGAGDVFNGALAFALLKNRSMKDAVVFACKAASLSVTRMGTQNAAPTYSEINDL